MIINGYEEYNNLKSRMDAEKYFQTRILRDYYAHPVVNDVLCCGVTFLSGDTYIYSVTHKDAHTFPVIETNNELNADVAVYKNGEHIDIHDYYTSYINETHTMFSRISDINKTVPIVLWGKILKKYNHKILELADFTMDSTYTFLDDAVSCLRTIERSGLAVDVEVFKDKFEDKTHRFIKDGKVYSQYFPYTMTGRPSNRFGSVNFSALNKSDGSRSAFISRFENGKLVQLDFESYHLRLIGNYMNVELPTEPVHQYLAKLYFGKENITDTEYEEGKQITFSILYGNEVETDIPLLNSIKSLSKEIYTSYLTNNVLFAPISGRKISIQELDATENKLFNYFVQSLEFESTVPKLSKILQALDNKVSKVLLYTYDAVLLDCHPEELSGIVGVVEEILSDGGYPLRMSIGTNYDNLTKKASLFDDTI
jgi:hypothetical protein